MYYLSIERRLHCIAMLLVTKPLEESNVALSLLYTDQHWTGMLLSNSCFWNPLPQPEARFLNEHVVFIQIQHN